MIAKALGFIDLINVLVMLLAPFLPNRLVLFFAMLLIAKGIVFASTGNPISSLDIIAGIYIGIIVYGWSNIVLTVFFSVFLAQKGLLSMLAR